MIWKDFQHPCPIWCIFRLQNNDVVTCGADGDVRIFTTREELFASDEVISLFQQTAEQVIEERRIKMANVQPVDPNTLTKIENAPVGTSDQQVKMFNKNGQAFAYQWQGSTWVVRRIVNGNRVIQFSFQFSETNQLLKGARRGIWRN